jgi:hypothetical protein
MMTPLQARRVSRVWLSLAVGLAASSFLLSIAAWGITHQAERPANVRQ